MSERLKRARCERSVIGSRPAGMCQVQSILPAMILPEFDWRLSAPLRTEQTDLGRVDFTALHASGPGQERPERHLNF